MCEDVTEKTHKHICLKVAFNKYSINVTIS